MRLPRSVALRLLPCVLAVVAASPARGQSAFSSTVPTFAPGGPNGPLLPQPSLPSDPMPHSVPVELELPPPVLSAAEETVSSRPVAVVPVFDGLDVPKPLSDDVVLPTVMPTDDAIQNLPDDVPPEILQTTATAADCDHQGGTVSEAPEPGGLTLCGLGLCGLLGYAWRRRRG